MQMEHALGTRCPNQMASQQACGGMGCGAIQRPEQDTQRGGGGPAGEREGGLPALLCPDQCQVISTISVLLFYSLLHSETRGRLHRLHSCGPHAGCQDYMAAGWIRHRTHSTVHRAPTCQSYSCYVHSLIWDQNHNRFTWQHSRI